MDELLKKINEKCNEALQECKELHDKSDGDKKEFWQGAAFGTKSIVSDIIHIINESIKENE